MGAAAGLIQRRGSPQDDLGLAAAKGLVVALLTAIPTPLPAVLVAGAGTAGAVTMFRQRQERKRLGTSEPGAVAELPRVAERDDPPPRQVAPEGSRMDICVEHPAVRNGVESPLGEGVMHGPTLAERTRGPNGRLRIPDSQMTVISGSPAYETLHTIFESESTAPMRLRTNKGDNLGLWNINSWPSRRSQTVPVDVPLQSAGE